MKQLNLLPRPSSAHGGVLAIGKRRSRRPLSTRHALHVTLKSEYAWGKRSLLRHRALVLRRLRDGAARFGIRIYQKAVCRNHIHLVIRGKSRESIQNFFRVIAGHIAQEILRENPLPPGAPPASPAGCKKNQRKFWSFLTFSRLISWGREFKTVCGYVVRNKLEALNVIPYQPRPLRIVSRRSLSGGL